MARRSKFGRFQVWNQPSDSWKHTDEAYNWDTLDLSIGGPNQTPTKGIGDDFNNPTTTPPSGEGQWLHPQDTTQITNFGNRTLYNIIRALDHNDVPLGAVFAWWRPSTDVPLPGGCVPADGSTYTGATQHSYVPYGLTSITVPDLRNKMILGAYETATGTSTIPLNRDEVAATLTDTATNGPGIRALGGSNVAKDLRHTHSAGFYIMPDHVHQMNNHVHDAAGHQHYDYHQHNVDISHSHSFAISGTASAASGDASANFREASTEPKSNASGRNSTHTVSASGSASLSYTVATGTPNQATGDAFGNTGYMIPSTQWVDQAKDRFTHAIVSSITGNSGAANAPALAALTSVDVLSRYVGLLWMVKIRKDGPLHNTAFTAGP